MKKWKVFVTRAHRNITLFYHKERTAHIHAAEISCLCRCVVCIKLQLNGWYNMPLSIITTIYERYMLVRMFYNLIWFSLRWLLFIVWLYRAIYMHIVLYKSWWNKYELRLPAASTYNIALTQLQYIEAAQKKTPCAMQKPLCGKFKTSIFYTKWSAQTALVHIT